MKGRGHVYMSIYNIDMGRKVLHVLGVSFGRGEILDEWWDHSCLGNTFYGGRKRGGKMV